MIYGCAVIVLHSQKTASNKFTLRAAGRKTSAPSRDCRTASCCTSGDGGSCWYLEKTTGRFWKNRRAQRANCQRRATRRRNGRSATTEFRIRQENRHRYHTARQNRRWQASD